MTFTEVSEAGYTSVETRDTAPPLPLGYLTAGAVYYDLNTTAEYSAPVTVCLPFDPNAYELPARLLHHDGTEWIDVSLTADETAGTICGDVESLSPFAIVAGDATVAPDTTIPIKPDAVTPEPVATFGFASNDPEASFECLIDLNLPVVPEWGSCDAPFEINGLLPGNYELQVRAVNALGNVDATPAVHAWTVVPPDTTILTGPPASSVHVDAEFTFESNDPLAEFECSLDNLPFSSCSTPHQVTGSSPGNHELRVRAINAVGTFDPTPASHTWTVKPLPDTAHHQPAGRPDRQQHGDLHVRLQPRRTPPSSAPSTTPPTAARSRRARRGSRTPASLFGEHAFAVRAVDADGNVDAIPAEWEWSVEGPVPPVLITSGPDVTTDSTTAEFVFAAEGSNLRYECSFDGGEFSLCVSPKIYNGVPLGPHDFAVQVYVDEEAGTDARPPPGSGRSWTTSRPRRRSSSARPTRAPTVDPETGESIATFAFESNDPQATFQCALDGAVAFTELPERRSLLRPGRGPAHPPRPRGRHRAPRRRLAGGVALDGRPRHDPAGDDDHERERHPDRGRVRGDRQLHRQRAGLRVPVPARLAAVRAVRLADGVQRPEPGHARVPRPRDRPRPERGAPAGEPAPSRSAPTRSRPRRRS